MQECFYNNECYNVTYVKSGITGMLIKPIVIHV